MAQKKSMKGVTSIIRNGVDYWYARVDGQREYCGKGEKGRELAEAARSKYVADRYEKRELSAGLNVRKPKLKRFVERSRGIGRYTFTDGGDGAEARLMFREIGYHPRGKI